MVIASLRPVSDGAAEPTRWRRHSGRSEPELAILEITERLLASTPLHELSVEAILQDAGVSRTAFYYYFASKHDVVAILVSRAFDEIAAGLASWTASDADDLRRLLRASLEEGIDVWRRHDAVLAATIENVHAVDVLRTVWLERVDQVTQLIARVIKHQRQAGAAPDGPPPETVAGTLVWSSERLLYLGIRGFDPAIPDLDTAGRALLELWQTVIYGPPSGSASIT
jgi:TetR/AcrR family transcriptional regulator, ethionamide resistance regulator